MTPGVLIEVKGEHIAAVTPGLTSPPAGATRLAGVTLPGLANAHSHVFHRALRGRTHEGAGSFWSWRDLMYGLAERVDPDTLLRLARAVFAEMVAAGFTAVGEFHYLHHGPGGKRYRNPNQMGVALMEAACDSGIRLTLIDACYLEGGFDLPLEGAQVRFGDGTAEAWIERVSRLPAGDGVRVAGAIHSVRAVPRSAAAQVAAWADEQGWLLHAHVSEQRREHQECLARRGTTPLGELFEAGAVNRRFTAVHGTHLSESDVTLLANERAGCCLCPTTERDLGDGIGPAVALDCAGVVLSVGTDSHAMIDGFEEARAVELDCRLGQEARGLLGPASLLEAATAGGMAALGWDSGSLTPGRLADLVSVRLDSPRTAGCDPSSVSTAVFAATAADVHSVVVGGRQVVADGHHPSGDTMGAELDAAISSLWP